VRCMSPELAARFVCFEYPPFGRCWGKPDIEISQNGANDPTETLAVHCASALCFRGYNVGPPSLGADISLTRDLQLALMWSSFTRRAYLL
jgi:hypothetical protein